MVPRQGHYQPRLLNGAPVPASGSGVVLSGSWVPSQAEPGSMEVEPVGRLRRLPLTSFSLYLGYTSYAAVGCYIPRGQALYSRSKGGFPFPIERGGGVITLGISVRKERHLGGAAGCQVSSFMMVHGCYGGTDCGRFCHNWQSGRYPRLGSS